MDPNDNRLPPALLLALLLLAAALVASRRPGGWDSLPWPASYLEPTLADRSQP